MPAILDFVHPHVQPTATATLKDHRSPYYIWTSSPRPSTDDRRVFAQTGPSFDRALPIEILAQVFRLGSNSPDADYTRFLITVSHVSRYWRDSALCIPDLWWDVAITIAIRIPRPTSTLDRCRAWLARAKRVPVRITVDVHRPSWGSLAPKNDQVTILISILQEHLAHCNSLILNNLSLGMLYPIGQGLIEADSTHLQQLAIKCWRVWEEEDKVAPLSLDMPALNALSLEDVPLVNLPTLSNLTSFHYASTYVGDYSPIPLEKVWALFRSSPNLEDLDINIGLDVIDDEQDDNEPARNRRYIDTTSIFQLLNLKRLSITFPSPETIGTVMSRISIPSIQTLSLSAKFDFNNAGPAFIPPFYFADEYYPDLQILEADGVPPTLVAALIPKAPALREFICANYYDSPSFIEILDTLISTRTDLVEAKAQHLESFHFGRCPALTSAHLVRLGEAYGATVLDGERIRSNKSGISLRVQECRYMSYRDLPILRLYFAPVEVSLNFLRPRELPVPFDFIVAPKWKDEPGRNSLRGSNGKPSQPRVVTML